MNPWLLQLLVLTNLVVSPACKMRESESVVQYSFRPAEQVFGSPLGRLVVEQLGFKNDLSPQKICVEEPPAPLTATEFLYETELAYVMWLHATGILDQNSWKTFQFILKADCPDLDQGYAAYAMVGKGNGENVPDALRKHFNKPEITCDVAEDGLQKKLACNTASLTLGMGGTGNIDVYFFKNAPEKWVELKAAGPARLAFNNFISWTGLAEELENAARSGTKADTAKALAQEWRAIVSSGKHDLSVLSTFAAKLTQEEIVATPDPRAREIIQDFFKSADPKPFITTYQPSLSLFHTLLHEVGHQLGMDHADTPDKTSTTGASSVNGKINADGQWVSKEATMAYGAAYLYLTDDDREGIAAQLKGLQSFYAKHK